MGAQFGILSFGFDTILVVLNTILVVPYWNYSTISKPFHVSEVSVGCPARTDR